VGWAGKDSLFCLVSVERGWGEWFGIWGGMECLLFLGGGRGRLVWR